jgi:hypothetical protein
MNSKLSRQPFWLLSIVLVVAGLLATGCSARMRGSEAGPAIDPVEVAKPADPKATTASVPGPTTAAKAKSDAPPTGETIVARHVLIQWIGADRASGSVVRTRDQARALADEIARRAKSGEDLGRLAVEYSDEPGAASRGGSLGRFGRGQMVPAFDAVVFSLAPGQISGVVETGFGYHIIQRIE